MAEAIAEIDIKADIDSVYAVISDFESYPDFLKDVKSVKVEKKTKKGALVTYEVSVVKTIKYTLETEFHPPKKLSWTLLKGDFMKSNEGYWELKETKKGLTHAKYVIDVGFGLLVPGSVAKTLVSSTLPAMMQAFKKHIEKK